MKYEYNQELLDAIDVLDFGEEFVHFLKTDFDITKVVVRDGDGNILDEAADPKGWDLPAAERHVSRCREHLADVLTEIAPGMDARGRQKLITRYRTESKRRAKQEEKERVEPAENPPPEPTIQESASCISFHAARLTALARNGDQQAITVLRDIGLHASRVLNDLAMTQSTRDALRGVASKSKNWPFDLSAIEEVRNPSKVKKKAGNPEDFAAHIRLGKALPIKTKGAGRDFRTLSGLALRAYNAICADQKTYGTRTIPQLSETHYHGWNYDWTQEKPESLRVLFVEYVNTIRDLTPGAGAERWAAAATLWARILTEDNIGKENIWPKEFYTKAKAGHGIIPRFRLYIEPGFAGLFK